MSWTRYNRLAGRATRLSVDSCADPLLSEREEYRQPLWQPRDVRRSRVGAQPVQRTQVETAAPVHDDARQRQGLQVEDGIGELLVRGAGDPLVLRLDRHAVAVARVAEEDVHLAVAAVHRLPDGELAAEIEPERQPDQGDQPLELGGGQLEGVDLARERGALRGAQRSGAFSRHHPLPDAARLPRAQPRQQLGRLGHRGRDSFQVELRPHDILLPDSAHARQARKSGGSSGPAGARSDRRTAASRSRGRMRNSSASSGVPASPSSQPAASAASRTSSAAQASSSRSGGAIGSTPSEAPLESPGGATSPSDGCRYARSMSPSRNLRPCARASTPTTPVPQNGSTTNSPGALLCSRSVRTTPFGFTAGPGTVDLAASSTSGMPRSASVRLPFSKNRMR